MWSFRSIYSVLLLIMWPRGRDSSEAAFQTASLGWVSSLQNYDREGKRSQNTVMKKLCQWKPICTKAYLHKPAEAPGWYLTFQDQTLQTHFVSEVTCNRLRDCAVDTQNLCLSASSMLCALSCSTQAGHLKISGCLHLEETVAKLEHHTNAEWWRDPPALVCCQPEPWQQP